MICQNCGADETDKDTINKSIKVFKMLLCKKCFKNYLTCVIEETDERRVGDGLQVKGGKNV